MDIQNAILGLFSFKPMTGYDIKKVMQKSPVTYWTGNNSQIYKALADLQANGFITAEILHDGAAPTKKRYTITELGRQELRDLSRGFPQMPELRKPFLLQLIFGRDLSRDELETIFNQYADELKGLLYAMDDQAFPEAKTELDIAIHDMTIKNVRHFYESEIAWIDEARKKILPLAEIKQYEKKGDVQMKYAPVNKNGQIYVVVTEGQIQTEQDGLTLVSACAEHGTNLLLLPAALSISIIAAVFIL